VRVFQEKATMGTDGTDDYEKLVNEWEMEVIDLWVADDQGFYGKHKLETRSNRVAGRDEIDLYGGWGVGPCLGDAIRSRGITNLLFSYGFSFLFFVFWTFGKTRHLFMFHFYEY